MEGGEKRVGMEGGNSRGGGVRGEEGEGTLPQGEALPETNAAYTANLHLMVGDLSEGDCLLGGLSQGEGHSIGLTLSISLSLCQKMLCFFVSSLPAFLNF